MKQINRIIYVIAFCAIFIVATTQATRGATRTWDGSTDTNWGEGTNWSGDAAPLSTDDAVIPDAATTPADPTVSSGAVCNNLTIQSSGILNGGSNTLTVSGDWSNSGTFNADTGTVTFDGAGAKNINTGGQSFATVTFNGSGSTWTLQTNNLSATTMNVTDGTLDVGASKTITVSGTLTINGGAITGTATISITAGAISQTSGTISNTGFNYIYLDGTGNFQLGTITSSAVYIGNTTKPSAVTINGVITASWNIYIYSNGNITQQSNLSGPLGTYLYPDFDEDSNGQFVYGSGTISASLGFYLYQKTAVVLNGGFTTDGNLNIGSAAYTPSSVTIGSPGPTTTSAGSNIDVYSNGNITVSSGSSFTTTSGTTMALRADDDLNGIGDIVIDGSASLPNSAYLRYQQASTITYNNGLTNLTGCTTGMLILISTAGSVNITAADATVHGAIALMSSAVANSIGNVTATTLSLYKKQTNNPTFTVADSSTINLTYAGTSTGLYIQANVTLNAGSNTGITTSSEWQNYGTFNGQSGTVTLNNTGTDKDIYMTAGSFNNFIINGAGSWRLANNITVGGTLQVQQGTFNANAKTVTATGLATLSGGIYQASTLKQTFNGGLTMSGGTLTASSGEVEVNGTLTISSGTLTGSTGELDINGDVALSGTGILTAPSGTFGVSGSWAKTGGTFTPGSNTVTFDGITQSDITGTNTFNNLTIDTTTDGAKTVRFGANQTQTITNTLSITGAAGKVLTIRSTVDGTQGTIDIPASITTGVNYVNVKDSKIDDANYTITAGTNSTDSLNNTNWIFGSGIARTITGSLYQSNRTTKLTTQTVRLSVNGASPVQQNASGGNFTFSNILLSSGDKILVWIDDDATPYEGNTITVSDGNDLSGLNVYAGHVVVRYETGSSITNANLSTAKGLLTDDDIKYTVAGSNLIVNDGFEFYIPATYTHTPGGTITVDDIEIDGILDANSQLTIGGTLTVSGGTLDGLNGTIDANGAVSITGGELIAPSGDFNVATNWSHAGGTFTHSNGTVVFDDNTQTSVISGTTTFYNLSCTTANKTIRVTAGTTQTVNNTLTMDGQDSATKITLHSTADNNSYTLNFPNGAQTIIYVDLRDCTAGASASIAYNSIDSTGNTNWTFLYVDPYGVVFDSVSNNPIQGALVAIFTSAGVQCTPGAEIALTDSNPQTTGADGAYSYDCINGDYYITITADGYTYPTTKADAELPAGRTIVTPGSRREPFTIAGVEKKIDHPLDSNNLLLKVKKDVNKKEVVIGDIVTYTITIKNETASDVTNVYLEDMIPAGFKYIKDRVILDNTSIPDPTGNRPILFNIGTVSAGQTRILKYQLVVGSSVTVGDYENSAVCKYSDGTVISNKDSETVKIVLDPLFDLGTIIGKVFWDENENGVQDNPKKPETRNQKTEGRSQMTETGIVGVQIVMEDGTIVTTDRDGQYHVPAIIPGRHILRINERTLPEGAYLTTDKVVIVDITPGILSKVNFGVNSQNRGQRSEVRRQTTVNREQNKKEPETDNRKPITAPRNCEAISGTESRKSFGFLGENRTPIAETYTQHIKTDDDYLLFIAMGDAKAGYTFNRGDIEPVEHDDKFREGFWSKGKFAYYLKGKIKGKYLVTSSLDTEREKKELFRSLDPDKYYPVYGDSSTINYDAANTQGMLYLLIEWDKSSVLWGNYITGFTDTEFAQFSRTLYGGKIHFESVSTTKFGEPNTKLLVFDARAHQRAAHNEFLGTGGSLFYLKHSNVIEGSENIKIEIRDKITGLVLTTKQMREGFDYEIDYSNGRIIFWKPVSYIVESDSIISSHLLDGNPVYVVVDYGYETKDEYDKGTQGARLQQSISDYLRIGGTYVKEEQLDRDYELKGLDATVHLGSNIRLTVEQAESKSEQAGSFISTDGGLSFTELSTLDRDKGKAYGMKGEAYLFDKWGLTSYYKKIGKGFSSGSTISQQGKELSGAGLAFDLTSQTRLAVSHDVQKLIDDGNPQTQLQMGAQETKTSTASMTHQMEKLKLTGEYRHQEIKEKLPAHPVSGKQFESQTNRDEDVIAAKADYKLTEKVAVSLEQQATLKGETNNQTSVGVSAQPNKSLSLQAKQTVAPEGTATSVGTAVKVDDKTDVYTTLSTTDSFENGQTQSVVLGSQQKLNEELALTVDRTYAKNRDNLTEGNTFGLTKEKDGRRLKGTFTEQQLQNKTTVSNTNIFGLSGDINDKFAMMGSFERGVVQNHDGAQATRNAGALGINYVDKDPERGAIRLKTSNKLEFRNDDGEENKGQYLIYNSVEWKTTINTTLFAKSNISQTQNTTTDSTEAQYKELVTGLAYRPVYFDTLNLLARYTYLEDDSPLEQSDFSDIEKERAHILAGELAYDLTDRWQLVGKLAYRTAEEKVTGFDFTKTQTWLNIHRLNYNINEDWQVGAEYRLLAQKQAKDYKQGALVEVNRKIGEFVQMGAGYNFTDFNDDLTHLDYTAQGPFIRLTAMLYDRTPEEIERARQRHLEEKIKQWADELVNKELADPNSPIMQKLYYYHYLAEKFYAEGKLKQARELYERITMAGQIMYNEAEKYIRERIELEKKLKENNQLALAYYKEGKLLEAKELWEEIITQAKPKTIFLDF